MPDVPRYVVDASVAAKWHLSDEEWVEPSLRVLADLINARSGQIQRQSQLSAVLTLIVNVYIEKTCECA